MGRERQGLTQTSCLALHPIEVRGTTLSGSRNTGHYRYARGRQDYHG